MATHRKYSDADKAMYLLALQANGGNMTKTARETGVPLVTLKHWRDGEGVNHDIPRLVAENKEPLADAFERIARIYIDRAQSDEAISKTHGERAVIAAATATDKMRLLRNEPTTITADVKLSDEERSSRITSIFDRARARRAG